ncbi:hypothetical protein BN179_180019 [Clostridioides difficile T6]|uniref:Uncharacterized protein n=1 Tax=Clostridioides difficile TaxID=1496 RepID=A0A068ZX99_CLODI|nr:hypothetical protein BN179_180019 [Clostridioides difficile T6]CCL53002.1 hypothetical protein BN180_140019 [Clostridioides difficile E14]CCL68929.1 hypothetical protein BN184_160019 [Clostridioides difficile T3]CCL85012.1 hypothetical protein BN188_210019 [Clostridioides difficile T19]CDS83354.1 conserved hypothetical protein [Clostridioides difficile]
MVIYPSIIPVMVSFTPYKVNNTMLSIFVAYSICIVLEINIDIMIAKSDLNKAGVPAGNSILSVPKNATILINTKIICILLI